MPAPDIARTASPAVDVRHVSLWREQTPILNDVTWRVEAGEHWAVIGPNGCGKTTLLNIVSAWLFPSRGEVAVLGNVFGDCEMAAVRRQIGWVSITVQQMISPQLLTLGVVLTGKHAVLGIREEPTAEELAAARHQLARVGCAHRAALPFGLLSHGEQMRVMIARALMSAPRLLILDEPCNGLDPVAREIFLETVAGLAAGPAALTLLFVTHHIEEIIPAVDHVLGLRAGRVAYAGPKAAALTPEALEGVFGTPFTVHRRGDRFLAHPTVAPGSIWQTPGNSSP